MAHQRRILPVKTVPSKNKNSNTGRIGIIAISFANVMFSVDLKLIGRVVGLCWL